jgi:hypothetical protein
VAHGVDELGVGGLFEHVAERAGAERLTREHRIVLHRQHDDPGLGRFFEDPGDRRQARLPGHVQGEDQHVWAMADELAHRGRDVARLGHHRHVLLGIQQQPKPGSHNGVVVGEHHGDRPAATSTRVHPRDDKSP